MDTPTTTRRLAPRRDYETEKTRDSARVVRSHSRTWTPAQMVTGIVGLFFVVLGAVAALRAGFADLTATAAVGPFTQTAVFAVIEALLGLFLLSATTSPRTVRGSSITLGVLMLAFGLVSLIEPTAMAAWVGEPDSLGALFILAGALVGAAGWAAPLIFSQSDRVTRDTHHSSQDLPR